MAQYVARLCWNSKGWTRPTGESAASESGTYATKIGYGHEEWLFNYQRVVDGWKYGFLQPVNKSYANVRGRTLDVRLYTISPRREWFYVGRIPKCEVLTEEDAKHARTAFRRNGGLKDMEAHVKQIGGKLEGLRYDEPQLTFNVRFRPADVELYDPMRAVDPDDGIRRLKRYTLVELDASRQDIIDEWPGRTGRITPKKTDKRRRKAVAASDIDPVHDQLQNELHALLQKRFGSSSVIMEENYADVTLRHEKLVHLIEVKSDPRPRKAIRDALGQLLEYAFRCERDGVKVGKLIVAAPGELGEQDKKYLEHLRESRVLPVHYVCVRRGMTALELPW